MRGSSIPIGPYLGSPEPDRAEVFSSTDFHFFRKKVSVSRGGQKWVKKWFLSHRAWHITQPQLTPGNRRGSACFNRAKVHRMFRTQMRSEPVGCRWCPGPPVYPVGEPRQKNLNLRGRPVGTSKGPGSTRMGGSRSQMGAPGPQNRSSNPFSY